MSSRNRSTRSSLRRKVVLPVTVFRQNGQEKQLAHTLDLTEASARLGGLLSLLESGEIIEIQRGAIKAKFQVFWMGAPGSAMQGQAGVRSIEPNKNIWGISLPSEEMDSARQARQLKTESESNTETRPAPEKRWHTRFECTGGASIRAEGSGFPVHGQVKDIAQGGVYVETTAPLTINTEVYVKMNVEGVAIESAGVIRTSYPMAGMGISFQNITPENQERVDGIIQSIRARTASPRNLTETAYTPANQPKSRPASLHLDAYPVRVLAMACRTLAADIDTWKASILPAELEELRLALVELQQKLSSAPQIELIDFFSSTLPRGGHA
jgi:PilZ domain